MMKISKTRFLTHLLANNLSLCTNDLFSNKLSENPVYSSLHNHIFLVTFYFLKKMIKNDYCKKFSVSFFITLYNLKKSVRKVLKIHYLTPYYKII